MARRYSLSYENQLYLRNSLRTILVANVVLSFASPWGVACFL